MPIVGGLDIHRKQITFDYLDTVTGQVRRGQIAPADRELLLAPRPAATAGHPAQDGHQPEPLNRIPPPGGSLPPRPA